MNQLNSAERRQILVDVHHRLDNSPKKKIEQDQAPKAAALRAWVLAADQHSALSTVLGKMRIAHGSLKTDALRERIFGIYGKIILKNKKDNYLDDLMGYLISPMHLSHGWEITYEGFAEHLTVVSARYSRETRKFPAKLLKAGVAGYEGYEGSRFVRKIEEIAYGEVVPDAIRHYLVASRTILEEFRNYSIDPDSIEVYRQNHISAYSTKYRVARRNCGANKFGASQDFYDQIIGEPPQAFCAFDTTPIEFRNGLIHMIADEDEEKLKWRLW